MSLSAGIQSTDIDLPPLDLPLRMPVHWIPANTGIAANLTYRCGDDEGLAV